MVAGISIVVTAAGLVAVLTYWYISEVQSGATDFKRLTSSVTRDELHSIAKPEILH